MKNILSFFLSFLICLESSMAAEGLSAPMSGRTVSQSSGPTSSLNTRATNTSATNTSATNTNATNPNATKRGVPRGAALSRLKDRFIEVTQEWNQTPTFGALVARLSLAEGEKKQLTQFLKVHGLKDETLGNLSFDPQTMAFRMDYRKETFSFRLLETAPKVLFFDGHSIFSFKPGLSLKNFFAQAPQPKASRGRSPKNGGRSSLRGVDGKNENGGRSPTSWFEGQSLKSEVFQWFELVFPRAQAQTQSQNQPQTQNSSTTPSQTLTPTLTQTDIQDAAYLNYQSSLEAKRKANAEHQSEIAKYCVFGFLIAFIGFLGLGYFMSDKSGGPFSLFSWGDSKSEKASAKARALYPEVHRLALQGEPDNVYDFSCEEKGESSPLKNISIGEDRTRTVAYDLTNYHGKVDRLVEALATAPKHAAFVKKVNECCLAYPCGKWLSEAVDGGIPRGAPPVDGSAAGGSPESKDGSNSNEVRSSQ